MVLAYITALVVAILLAVLVARIQIGAVTWVTDGRNGSRLSLYFRTSLSRGTCSRARDVVVFVRSGAEFLTQPTRSLGAVESNGQRVVVRKQWMFAKPEDRIRQKAKKCKLSRQRR